MAACRRMSPAPSTVRMQPALVLDRFPEEPIDAGESRHLGLGPANMNQTDARILEQVPLRVLRPGRNQPRISFVNRELELSTIRGFVDQSEVPSLQRGNRGFVVVRLLFRGLTSRWTFASNSWNAVSSCSQRSVNGSVPELSPGGAIASGWVFHSSQSLASRSSICHQSVGSIRLTASSGPVSDVNRRFRPAEGATSLVRSCRASEKAQRRPGT